MIEIGCKHFDREKGKQLEILLFNIVEQKFRFDDVRIKFRWKFPSSSLGHSNHDTSDKFRNNLEQKKQ